MVEFSEGHALVIGVGKYEAADWSVPVTANDAGAIAAALADPDIAAYPPGQVQFLHGDGQDDGATLDGIRSGFQKLAAVPPTATVLIYFCGHGVLGEDGREYYLTAHDTQFTTTNLVKDGSGVGEAELLRLLKAIRVKKLLLIVNACLSGQISRGGTLGAPGTQGTEAAPARSVRTLGASPPPQFKAVLLGSGEGRCFLAASRPSQDSRYDSDNFTYFGQALLRGLQDRDGAIGGQGRAIGLYELYTYVYQQVKQQSNGRQEPMLTMENTVGPFVVALRPATSSARGLGGPIQQEPSPSAPVERVPPTVITGVQLAARRIVVKGNQINAPLVDLRGQINIGTQTISNITGGGIKNITLTLNPAAAVQVSARDQLPGLIDQSLADLDKLDQAPAAADTRSERRTARFALSEAREAVTDDDMDTARQKLDEAATVLTGLSGHIAAALPISQAVSALLARASGL